MKHADTDDLAILLSFCALYAKINVNLPLCLTNYRAMNTYPVLN